MAIYLLWTSIFVGQRQDHLYFAVFVAIMFFLTERTHKFSVGFIFFIIFWVLYDSLQVLPNYTVSQIRVLEPYEIEKSLFGVQNGTEIITPNEYFFANTNPVLSFISGLFYLFWVPLPLFYAFYLLVNDPRASINFSFVFLLTNLVGFVGYYTYPAAPPWYVYYHGFEVDFSTPGNAALLLLFDEMIGVGIYEGMYNQNNNVFAAIPSLHSAFPVLLVIFAARKKQWLATGFFTLVMLGIWFGAVYSGHHYIIDVILGAFCAIFAFLLFDKLLIRTRLKIWLETLSSYVRM